LQGKETRKNNIERVRKEKKKKKGNCSQMKKGTERQKKRKKRVWFLEVLERKA
jgi:putative IMPACT (imprinted ancient) family translation regulator